MGDTSLRRFHYLLESLDGWPGERAIEIPPEGIPIPEEDMIEEETKVPEPRSKSAVTIPQVQRWYDDAMEGNFTNPFLREDIGGDLDQKEQFIYDKLLPLFEPSEGLRGKMRHQWAAERDQVASAPPPSPSPVPTMDDILTEAMGMSGQSGQKYQQ
jgi:hypothetical protein